MAPYNSQYGNYYDPVGSHGTNQPTGYTYQQPAANNAQYQSSTTSANNYSTAGYNYGSNSACTRQQQQYGQSAQNTSSNRAAEALSSLSTTADYTQSSTAPSTSYSNYPSYNVTRTQDTNSPLYATQGSASTFGRLSLPDQSATTPSAYQQQTYQSSRTSNAPSTQSYQTSHAQLQPPQRYASPLHAVQASRSSAERHQPSPQLAAQNLQHQHQRQQSASLEPSTTVNPSQVYDDRAERQRQARIEAEKRRKREEQEAAARKAEEEARKAEEARKPEEERIAAERERVEAEKRKAEEEAAAAAIAKQKAEQEATKRKEQAERRKKAREEKKASKSAASTLQQMASRGAGAAEAPPANDEEAEMRAMFKKMREFNAKNPAMLAKLWEEERKAHASQSPQGGSPAQPAAPAALQQAKAPAKQTKKAAQATQADQAAQAAPSGNAPSTGPGSQQYRPFQKPPAPAMAPVAAPAPTPTPASHSPGSAASLWPPHKKGTLAEAAATWLMGLPENSGRRITREDVLKILETNPSYVQLCEKLERFGLRFERSLLARQLLKAVPDGLKGHAPAGAAPTKPFTAVNGMAQASAAAATPKKRSRKPKETTRQSNGNGTVDYETPSFPSLAVAAQEVNNMKFGPGSQYSAPVQAPSPYPAHSPPVHATPPVPTPPMASGSRAPSQSQPPLEVKLEVVEEPPRPPANKEEAARKRTFGDLVDLTADLSDDEPPPRKKIFLPNGQNGMGMGMGVTKPQAGPSFTQPLAARDFYRPGQAPPPPRGGVPMPKAAVPSNTPAEAAPPRPVAPPPKPKGPSQEQLQMERIRGKMIVEPIMRDRVARKSRYDPRTIARDVLLATGRHPDMRGLNAHLLPMSKLLADKGGSYEGGGNKSDLSTIRWDLLDPEPPKPKVDGAASAAAAETTASTVAAGKKPVAIDNAILTTDLRDETEDADDEGQGGVVAPVRQFEEHQAVNHRDGTVSYSSVMRPAATHAVGKDGIVKKRRGRPRHTLPAGGINVAAGGDNTPKRLAPGPNKTPQSAPAAGAGQPLGYSAFRQLDADGNVIKKKGRPVGWRKAVHSREAAGLASASQPGRSKKSVAEQAQGEMK
jgi:hypothetical protein